MPWKETHGRGLKRSSRREKKKVRGREGQTERWEVAAGGA